MLPIERRNKLMQVLREKGAAKTEELASLLQVSEMTVRRDLAYCEKIGLLQRCHGGAKINRQTILEVAYEQKMTSGIDIKRKIAKAAAALVRPGMTVYLDAGTTTFCIAEELAQLDPLTVITNDLKIALRLLDAPAELIVLGGSVQKRTGSMLGSETIRQLRELRASIAFIGAASIDGQLYTLTPTGEKVALKRSIHSIAQTCYLVSDASKFQKSSLHVIDHLSDFDGIITNAVFSEQEKKMLGKKNRLLSVSG